jgi:GNAT superfamily N-acetyltransferase
VSPDPFSIRIERAGIADYDALARFHYRSGRPATVVRILRAIDPVDETLCAVLVISMPTIDGAWRRLAWPGHYDQQRIGKRQALARINAELRTISRVIVEPRYRALGIARRLVRAYLDNPLTPATEAVAAMGIACPFFRRAGMTEYRLPPSRADARLLDALAHARLAPDALADVESSARAARDPFLSRELRTWASWSKPGRSVRGWAPEDIAPIAATCLLARPIAFCASCATIRGSARVVSSRIQSQPVQSDG